MQVTTFGRPAGRDDRRLIRSDRSGIEQRLAFGCTLKTTALPAASIPIALQMIVDVGFVAGVMAPMTPNGAGSVSIRPWSPVTAVEPRSSRPGRLLGDQEVLDDLVLDAAEAGLLVRHLGQALAVLEHRRRGSPR